MHAARKVGIVVLASLASAALFALAQNVPGWAWISLLCLLPVCAAVDCASFLKSWATFGIFAFLSGLFTVWWISHTGPGYYRAVPLVGIYTALWYALIALACRICPWRNAADPLLAVPAGFWLAEVCQRRFLLQVSPTLLGQPLADWAPTAQIAAIGGPEALTFLAAATSVGVAMLLRKCSRACRLAALIQGPVLVAVASAAGAVFLAQRSGPAETLRVGLVQPDVHYIEKWDPARRSATLARLNTSIDQAVASGAEIVILPETAVTGFVRYESELSDFVKGAVARTLTPLLFGSLDRNDNATEFYNVAALVTPYNTVTFYRKRRLVPLTEYRPAGLPWAGRLRDRGGPEVFTPGVESTMFELIPQRLRFGVLICVEDIFPDLSRDSAAAGAQFLVALVNTERFTGTPQPLQHLRRAQLSALASGLPMIRATNSGVSGAIDSHGRLTEVLPPGGISRTVVLTIAPVRTPYRAFGDSLVVVFLVFLFAVAHGAHRLSHRVATDPIVRLNQLP